MSTFFIGKDKKYLCLLPICVVLINKRNEL
jgi:hypothetical protein